MMPPDAITGTLTRAAIARTRSSVGAAMRARLGALRDDGIDPRPFERHAFIDARSRAEDNDARRPQPRQRFGIGHAEGEAEHRRPLLDHGHE